MSRVTWQAGSSRPAPSSWVPRVLGATGSEVPGSGGNDEGQRRTLSRDGPPISHSSVCFRADIASESCWTRQRAAGDSGPRDSPRCSRSLPGNKQAGRRDRRSGCFLRAAARVTCPGARARPPQRGDRHRATSPVLPEGPGMGPHSAATQGKEGGARRQLGKSLGHPLYQWPATRQLCDGASETQR